jgi:DNA-binding XRE family transcriptional regulator
MTAHPDPIMQQLLEQRPGAAAEYDRLRPRYDFIAAVVKARAERGWSQADLARELGLPRSAISRLEAGDTDPRLSTVVAVCGALGLPLRIGTARSETRLAG